MSENANAAVSDKPAAGPSQDPRIDEVEKDVKKLKADVDNFMALKNTVEDLKNTIVDIRSLISEAQSPFNLLQFITNEDDLNKVVQAKPLVEKKLQTAKQAETKTEAKNAAETQTGASPTSPAETPATCEGEKTDKTVGFAVESDIEGKGTDETHPSLEPEKTETPDAATTLNRLYGNPSEIMGNPGGGTSIVDWTYTMLDLGFDEESIRKICEYCEFSNFMPKGYSEHVSNLVGAIVKARSQKLTPEEVVLSMYGAADAAGTKNNPKDLMPLIMRVLKKNKPGGQ